MILEDVMSKRFVCVGRDSTLEEAIRAFLESRAEGLPVVNGDGRLVGYLPSRRLLRGILKEGHLGASIASFVVSDPFVLQPNLSYEEVCEIVKTSPVGSAPVVDEGGRPVGVLEKLNMVLAALRQEGRLRSELQSVFNAMHNGVITVDRAARVVMANEAALRTLELSEQEVVGRPIREILPGFDCGGVLRSGQRCVGLKCTLPNGKALLINVSPICENGRIVGANAVFQDLTDLERVGQELSVVRELQEMLSAVIEASYEGMLVVDEQGKIMYCNHAIAEFMGVDVEDLKGRAIKDVLPDIGPHVLSRTGEFGGLSEVGQIRGKRVVYSVVPVLRDRRSVGTVVRVFFGENKLTEELIWKLGSLTRQVSYYRKQLEFHAKTECGFDSILTANAEMMRIKQEAERIAMGDSSVLILGESGVGKELFARAIHAASQRSSGPFIKVNCAAIPETLLESELFGYEGGAFTGALKSGKPGRFELANGGTIFLDEIGDMPLALQAKLLQVLQDRQFERVGGTKPKRADVRIISATNRDIRRMVEVGAFRMDLYYRLNVIEFHIPALRNRPEDIPLLAEFFVKKYNAMLGACVSGVTPAAMDVLVGYHWPGNVRELENAIERAVNYAWDGAIRVEHLPRTLVQGHGRRGYGSYREKLREVDRELVIEALRVCGGNKSKAAKMLNVSRTSLYDKISKYGIEE